MAIVFVVRKEQEIFAWSVWLAFRPNVWPLIFILIIVISIMFQLLLNRAGKAKVEKLTRVQKRAIQLLTRKSLPEKPLMHVYCFKALELTIQPLLGQPLSKSQIGDNPRRLFKLLLITWWFSCLIITTLYSTSLITSLLNPVTPKGPESLKALIDSGYRFKLGCKHGVVFELIMSIKEDNFGKEKTGKDSNEQTFKLLKQIRSRLVKTNANGDLEFPVQYSRSDI